MIIGVLGSCDKRPYIYPLLKLLNESGDVLFVTDNNQCMRLIEGTDLGTYQNITVVVTSASPDQVWEDIGYRPEDFDHVVFDLKYYLVDEADEYVYLYTIEKQEDEEEVLELVPGYHEFKLTYGKLTKEEKKLKGVINVTLRDIFANEYLEVVAFPSYINKSINNALYEVVQDHLRIPRKEFDGIMKKEVKL